MNGDMFLDTVHLMRGVMDMSLHLQEHTYFQFGTYIKANPVMLELYIRRSLERIWNV